MPRPMPPHRLPTQAQRPRECVILTRCVRIEESGWGGEASSTFASASTANLCSSSLAAPVSTAITDSTQLSTLHLLKKPPRGSPEEDSPLWREFEGVPQILLYKPSWAGWWVPPTSDSQPSIVPLSTANSDSRDRHLSPYLPHQPAHPETLEGRAHTAFRPSSGAGRWLPPTSAFQSMPVLTPITTSNSP